MLNSRVNFGLVVPIGRHPFSRPLGQPVRCLLKLANLSLGSGQDDRVLHAPSRSQLHEWLCHGCSPSPPRRHARPHGCWRGRSSPESEGLLALIKDATASPYSCGIRSACSRLSVDHSSRIHDVPDGAGAYETAGVCPRPHPDRLQPVTGVRRVTSIVAKPPRTTRRREPQPG